MTARITSAKYPLSFLQQRLMYVGSHPDKQWTLFLETIPRWPAGHNFRSLDMATAIDYESCFGSGSLISEISRRENQMYQFAPNPKEVLITNGGFHALSLIIKMHSRPKAIALCQAPMLRCLEENLLNNGYEVQYFETINGDVNLVGFPDAWDRVALVYLNSPHNPTGQILSARTIEFFAEILRRHSHIKLILDLVYDSFVFNGSAISSRALFNELDSTYFVNSASKNYGVPGLRTGWVISGEKNILKLATLLEQECGAICGPAQNLLTELIQNGNSLLVNSVREKIDLINEILSPCKYINFSKPKSGVLYFVELPVTDVEEFADFLMLEHQLVVATAHNYVGVKGSFIRIPAGYNKDTIVAALALLLKGLQEWMERKSSQIVSIENQ